MEVQEQGDDFKYTYKLQKDISTIKGGVKVLRDLEYPLEIINNTISVLKEIVI
jgi:DNA mismatch repair ATPase MutS